MSFHDLKAYWVIIISVACFHYIWDWGWYHTEIEVQGGFQWFGKFCMSASATRCIFRYLKVPNRVIFLSQNFILHY